MNEGPLDDRVILLRIAKQDQAAFSALYDRYARIVYSIALRSLRSVEESEEVVLDVFAQVWRIAERYDASKSRVDTWLFMLARSRVLDRLRKIQRRTPATGAVIDLEEIQLPAKGVDLMEAAELSEQQERVRSTLSQLPLEQRLVVELAYYQGLSHGDIAHQTGMALGTVKTRIRLGLNRLRTALEVLEA
jgi:RNA polymerase sigma-70 factor, ECF subfamily